MRRSFAVLLLFLALPLASADRVSDICPALSFAQPGQMEPLIAKATDLPVRILAFGDFGDGGRTQLDLARAMAEYGRRQPFDLGITLGDNFYETGLNSPTHPRWASDWETPYAPLGIRFYATLGNHDYADPSSPGAEMERSRLSASWCLPHPYYSFTAGPVQLFALDTEPVRRLDGAYIEAQKRWLENALEKSQSPWKVVYGHHPIYSTGQHGDTPELIAEILPLLQKHKVDVYLAGHEHDLQALQPEGGVYFFVSGAGGHGLRDVTSRTTCREWALGRFAGFTVLDANATEMKVLFVGSDAQVVKGFTLKKGVPAMPECPR
ncbi:MAG TPA: metallophosphoesterase [Thermoanaerobaculia bacterium]|nr:metallophosphoesterase [Thermoanaerobaculia bacterium]